MFWLLCIQTAIEEHKFRGKAATEMATEASLANIHFLLYVHKPIDGRTVRSQIAQRPSLLPRMPHHTKIAVLSVDNQ